MARGIERIGEQRRVSGTVRFDTVPTSRPGPKKESPAEPAALSKIIVGNKKEKRED